MQVTRASPRPLLGLRLMSLMFPVRFLSLLVYVAKERWASRR